LKETVALSTTKMDYPMKLEQKLEKLLNTVKEDE